MSGQVCSLDGCGLQYVAGGFCNAHYKRHRLGQDMSAPVGTLRPKGISLVRDERGCKHCIGCDKWLPEDAYAPGRKNQDGLTSHCRACHRSRKRLSRYQMKPLQVQELLAAQSGECAGCGASAPGGHGEWCIDHDHLCCPGRSSCGKCIRGLLCLLCNSTLGHAKDNPAILRSLAAYLERAQS